MKERMRMNGGVIALQTGGLDDWIFSSRAKRFGAN